VNPRLFERVRRALDDAGYGRVRIVVSRRVRRRVHPRVRGARARVDSYGVGSALLRGANDFTADVVRLNGRECAKAGRCYVASDRLELVT
jgi:nicotinate phosphoribosyltransferase